MSESVNMNGVNVKVAHRQWAVCKALEAASKADPKEFEDLPVLDGFSRRQLQEMFSRLHGERDWRDEFWAVIDASELRLARAATEFFTATPLLVESRRAGKVCVHSIGYRNGPAGDH